MAGVEAFTLLAVFDAVDRASKYIDRIDKSFNDLAASAERAAGIVAETSGKIDASLLSTASGADAVELAQARVQAAEARSALATQELAKAQTDLMDVQSKVASGALAGADAERAQAAALDTLIAAEKEAALTAKTLSDANLRLDLTQKAAADSAATTSMRQKVLGGIASVNSGVMGKVLNATIGASIAVGGLGYESLKAAANYQTLTVRLVTSAGEQQKNLAYVRQAMMDLAVQTGTTASELAKGMYTVESAGYHGADGISVLRAATEGARQEGANFGTVANAVTDVLKDYHKGANQAANVTSQMVEAVAQGKTNFQNLSTAMANVLPLSSKMHLSFADVSGVLAEMTNHGMTAQRASMDMANALSHLAGPTNGMIKEMKHFGITSDDLSKHLSKVGLAGTLQWLSDVAKKGTTTQAQYVDALHKLVGTVPGLQTALMVTGKNAKDTNAAIKAISGATADASGNVKGFSDVQDTLAFKMSQAKAAVDNMGISIGTALLPVVTQLMTKINGLLVPLMKWITTHKHLTTQIIEGAIALGGLALAIKAVGIAAGILNTTLTFIEENPVVAAIIAIVVVLVILYTKFKVVRDIVNALGTFLKTAFLAAWRTAGAVINWFSTNVLPYVKEAVKAVFDWFKAHKKEFSDAWNSLVKAVHESVKWFDKNVLQWLKARIKDVEVWWKAHSTEIEDVFKVMFAIMKVLAIGWWYGMKVLLTIIKGTWTNVWTVIKDTLILVWDVIKNTITYAMHLILNIIAVILDVITGHWGKAWKDMKKLVSQALTDTWNFIKSFFSDAGTWLYDAGKKIIDGMINGIKSMLGPISSAMSSVTGWINGFLPHSPAKMGPLSGSGSPEIAGRKIGQMVASGIGSSIPEVSAATSKLAENAAGTYKSSLISKISMSGALTAALTGTALAPKATPTGMPALTGLTGGTTTAGNTYYFDLRESKIMSERDMDDLVNKIGQRLAVRTLPAGGMRVRM